MDAEGSGEPPSMQEVMDDLALRFVVNCPEEEHESVERLLFQVEAAFWFYDDQYREIWPTKFPTFNLLTFSKSLFSHCSLLSAFEHRTKEIYEAFTQYKYQIPTCGAMLLTPDKSKLLLVKSWKGNSWGFPKGKIDRDEDKLACAVREVDEEVGFNISGMIDPEAFIELQIGNYPTLRLYIVTGVPEATVFETRTKKEIGAIEWHKLKEIPTHKDVQGKGKAFWMVGPYVKRLQDWLAARAKQEKKASKQSASKSAPPPASAPPEKPPGEKRKESKSAPPPDKPVEKRKEGDREKKRAASTNCVPLTAQRAQPASVEQAQPQRDRAPAKDKQVSVLKSKSQRGAAPAAASPVPSFGEDFRFDTEAILAAL